MNLISLGIAFVFIGIVVYWFSPGSPHNIGYRSLQSARNKNIWFWSNRFFGRLCLTGSVIFLITAILLELLNMGKSDIGKWTEIIFLSYIILSVVITEIYIFIKALRDKAK